MTRPAHLYKYYAFNARTLACVKNRLLYFSNAAAFNDPFDCQYHLTAPDFSDEEIEEILAQAESEGVDTKSYREAVARDPSIQRTRFAGYAQRAREILEKEFAQRGVCCFSSRLDSLLMWGHYGDGHRGFCLEFDATHFPFTKARQVTHQTDYPKISPAPLILGREDEVFEACMCTKSVEWSYEDEWRLFHAEANKEYCYGSPPLTRILFGTKMDFVNKELLALVVRGSPTRLCDTVLSPTQFTVQLRDVVYTPHPHAGGGAPNPSLQRTTLNSYAARRPNQQS